MTEPEYKLHITPSVPDFGMLCQGFVYSMKISVFNSGMRPERLRVFCQPLEGEANTMTATYEPCRLAPGMSTDILLKIDAGYLCMSSCKLRIVQASTQVEKSWIISGTVIPVETYKKVTKSIKISGGSVTAERVKTCGQIPHLQDADNDNNHNNNNALQPIDENQVISDQSGQEETGGILTGNTNNTSGPGINKNIFSKAFMDREEISEIKDMPMIDCMYYDPWEKKLKVDDTMLAVDVDTKWNVDQSKEITEKKWNNRLSELEDKGMFSTRTASLLSNAGSRNDSQRNSISGPANSNIDNSNDNNNDNINLGNVERYPNHEDDIFGDNGDSGGEGGNGSNDMGHGLGEGSIAINPNPNDQPNPSNFHEPSMEMPGFENLFA